MKKILLIILIFTALLMALYSNQTLETTEACQVRDSSAWRTSEKIGIAIGGWEFETIDTFGDWYLVNLSVGTTICLDRKEKPERIKLKEPLQIYVWSGCLDVQNSVIINSGVNIRSGPEKNESTYKGSILQGTKVEIIECLVTWYKVKPKMPNNLQWSTGWISARMVKFIE